MGYNHLSVEDAKNLMNGALKDANNRTEQRTAMGSVDTFRPRAVLGDWNEKNRSICLEVAAIAKERCRTPTQIALNWNLMKSETTSPIFAVRNQVQLDEVIGSLAFQLTKEQMQRLDDVSNIDMGFPQRWGLAPK